MEGINYLKENYYKSIESFDKNPIIVICGDTLIHDDFWSFIFETAKKKIVNKSPFAVFAASDFTKNLHEKSIQSKVKFQSHNLQSFFVIKKGSHDDTKNKINYKKINFRNVVDVIDRPLYPVFNLKNYLNKENILAKFTGLILMNSKMWKEILNVKNQIANYFFIKHFINYFIFPYLSRKANIDICLSEESINNVCFDINFPWEHLNADRVIKEAYLDWYLANCKCELDHPNLEGYDVEILMSDSMSNKMSDKIDNHPNGSKFRELLDNKKFRKFRWINDSDNWISSRAAVNGMIIKPIGCNPKFIDDFATIEGVCVLKAGCYIGKNVLVENSNLDERVFIEANTIIKNSIILSGTRIMSFCNIAFSIIGSDVLIGGNVCILYRKLVNSNVNPQNANYSSSYNEKYFTEIDVICHKNEFGTIIGDGTRESLLGA
ncbi:MAG: hypothetical protein ABII93_03800 [Chrysiogenia bacterium]